jgi:xylulokinase
MSTRAQSTPSSRAAASRSRSRPARQLVCGVDCSTQGTKVLVVDVEIGEIVGSGRAEHSVSGRDGARETDPEEWWRALASALDQTGCKDDIAAISIGAQQHGLVVIDKAGRPLRRAILWNDVRSAPDSLAIISALGGPARTAELIGSLPLAAFTVTSWAWLRRMEPEIVARVSGVRLPHDWLTERLTGNAVTDRGDVSGTGWWSTATEAYVPEVLDNPLVQLAPESVPRVLQATEAAGKIRAEAAQQLGLSTEVIVGPGTGDNPAAALAIGLRMGEPAMSLGTSGTVYTKSSERSADPTGVVVGMADATGQFLPLACTLNCTLAVDRVAAWMSLDREDVADSTRAVVLPYLDGERTPNLPDSAGSIVGLRHDTSPREILLAAYEGAAWSLIEAMSALGPLDPGAPIVLIGGGAQGAAWQKTVRRLSGRAVIVPDAKELVALGAAIQAAVVLTGDSFDSFVEGWNTRAGLVLEPMERDVARLDQIRSVYSRLEQFNTSPFNREG